MTSISPDCSRCGISLDNWEGNVMVDATAMIYESTYKGVCIICKKCTAKMGRGTGSLGANYHNLWELGELKEAPMAHWGTIVRDLIDNSKTVWEPEAVREMGFIISLTMSYNEAVLFLRHLNPTEWDYDGHYLCRLKGKYGISC